MDKLKIKGRIESMVCNKHKKSPTVTIIGDEYKVSACCDDMREKARHVLTEAITGSFKDLFKGLGG